MRGVGTKTKAALLGKLAGLHGWSSERTQKIGKIRLGRQAEARSQRAL